MKKRQVNVDTAQALEQNITQLEKIMSEINEALSIMDTDVQALADVVNEFDIIALFHDIRKTFQQQFEYAHIILNASMDEQLLVQLNKVTDRLILHNILSNVVKYATPATEVVFEIFTEKHILYISCQNEANAKNIARIQKSEELFYAILAEDTTVGAQEYVYSTGNGLYLVKELAKIAGGWYQLIVVGNSITIQVTIPQTGGDHNDA